MSFVTMIEKDCIEFETGLNIQHDANHGSVSRNPNVNWLLGLSENWIGGSQINWIHQHVVQHHLHTNDVHLDPDMASTSYVRSDFIFYLQGDTSG